MTATNPHTKSDRTSIQVPHLWVSNPEIGQALRTFLPVSKVCSPIDEPDDDAQYHILALDTERETRQVARKLGEENVRIVPLDRSLEAFLLWHKGDDDSINDTILGHKDYNTWLERLADRRIVLKDALDMAEDILTAEMSKNDRKVELDGLKARYLMSYPGSHPLDWKQYIENLEAEIHARVDGRSAAHPEAGELRRSRGRFKQRYHAVEEFWGEKLRFNTLKQRVELDGEPLDLDFVRATLCVELDIDIPKEEAVEIVLCLARENSYCPIVEYLERVEAAHPQPDINWDSLAKYLLGTPDPLHAIYLKRHLIGSVARAFNPGCQMDTALILQGDQGIGKSSFFRALYGDEFFDDTMAEASDKDELMKLHQHWAVEWAEFETQLSRKGYSRLKQFMTTKVDNYRPPYGRTSKSFRRHSVLVGSTNEAEFLNDPSGDRRYWVLPVKSKIDTRLTAELRDSIWASACVAYRSGEQWWLTEQEKQLAKEANKPFRVSDTWEEYIRAYICDRSFITIAELLDKALDIESGKQDKGSQMRASAILTRLHWEKGRSYQNGTRMRGWVPSDRFVGPPGHPPDEGGPIGGPTLETLEFNASSQTGPPGHQTDPHFAELVEVADKTTLLETEESLDQGGPGGPIEVLKSLEPCQTAPSDVGPPLTETYQGLTLGDRVEYDGNSEPAQKKFGGHQMTVIGFNRPIGTVICSSPAGTYEGGHWTVRKVEADRCHRLSTETSSDRQ